MKIKDSKRSHTEVRILLPCSSFRTKPSCSTATRGVQAGDVTEVGGQEARSHHTQRCADWLCGTPQDCRTLLMEVRRWRLGTSRLSEFVCICVCVITHIMCDLAQGPDRVYSLYSVIGDYYGGLTAAENYFHGGVRCILHTRTFKLAWKTHTHIQRFRPKCGDNSLIENRERGKVSVFFTCRFTHYWCNLI